MTMPMTERETASLRETITSVRQLAEWITDRSDRLPMTDLEAECELRTLADFAERVLNATEAPTP